MARNRNGQATLGAMEISLPVTLAVLGGALLHASWNALLKARYTAKMTGLPSISDDSGLCIDALGGAPGIFSAKSKRKT